MAKELLLEIGTEEIPAAFLPKAMGDMEELIGRAFRENRIAHGTVKALATPRRLVLRVEEVAETQEDQVVEKLGPATKVAFDEKGNPTKAAVGFAKGQGLEVSQLETVKTEKGDYLCARKTIKGGATRDILPGILKDLILAIPFKKSMRWSSFEIRFARPIHWILALFGSEVIPFKLEYLQSGNLSYGHRFMSPGPFAVRDFGDYLEKARAAFVIPDPQERREIIIAQAREAADEVGGVPLVNEELLETVTFLVEYPTAVRGAYDPSYLKLPREVLVTSMMSHQKYFPVADREGRLMPFFITVNNTLARDPQVVARGNEKVIRARLADAKFFFEEDQKIPLDKRVEDLKKVVYHSMLGTSYEKVQRFRALAAYMAERIDPRLRETVDRAAYLAKADLDTQMVGEFSELQGVMGREYALLAGEDPKVATAIYEHYLPTAAGGELPETDEGAIVSIADKMDTIVGFFGVNLVPSGTADPYALRRQALGIINIILAKAYPIRLDDLVAKSAEILGDKLKRPAETVCREVLDFIKARLENLLVSQGHPYDVVDAVLATGFADLGQVLKKIHAVESFRTGPEFAPLAVTFKRVGNIIKDFPGGTADEGLFATELEKGLYGAFLSCRRKAQGFLEKGDLEGALREMAALRGPVDAFFDGVMVMDKDERIKNNRQSLLWEIAGLFKEVADFSKIVTEG